MRDIEDLQNLVLGAKLETIQMAGRRVGGSLAFSAANGVIFSSGLIEGNAYVRGVLSEEAVTFAFGLFWGRGSRICLHPVTSGCMGVIMPGDQVEMLITSGSLYVAAAIATERIDRRLFGDLRRSGLHWEKPDSVFVKAVSGALLRLHAGETSISGFNVGRAVLDEAALHQVGQEPGHCPEYTPHETIVLAARRYVEEHLATPILVGELAMACGVSPRSVYRAFIDVLGETPNGFVRRLRLHRIRGDLLSGKHMTIEATSAHWGINEHGRMSGWYRDVFGEQPSATLATRHRRGLSQTWL